MIIVSTLILVIMNVSSWTKKLPSYMLLLLLFYYFLYIILSLTRHWVPTNKYYINIINKIFICDTPIGDFKKPE